MPSWRTARGYLRAAFEFRHASWMDAEVFERLRARNLTLCIADSEKFSTPVEITADYAYFRLRDEGYTPGPTSRWARTIREKTARCRDVFVYFKHEEAGKGPQFARLLAALTLGPCPGAGCIQKAPLTCIYKGEPALLTRSIPWNSDPFVAIAFWIFVAIATVAASFRLQEAPADARAAAHGDREGTAARSGARRAPDGPGEVPG